MKYQIPSEQLKEYKDSQAELNFFSVDPLKALLTVMY